MRKMRFPVKRNDSHLQNHRNRFEHENAADGKQQNLLLDGHGDHSDRAAERQRADVAHEHFGGMRVVPKKCQRRADERAAKNRELAHLRQMLNVEIGAETARGW